MKKLDIFIKSMPNFYWLGLIPIQKLSKFPLKIEFLSQKYD